VPASCATTCCATGHRDASRDGCSGEARRDGSSHRRHADRPENGLNAFLVYLDLAALGSAALAPRSSLIITYAICGFSNRDTLGIMIGGLIAMVPERRADIVALGTRSRLVSALATWHSGAIIDALSQ
jgi:hypothetical protein